MIGKTLSNRYTVDKKIGDGGMQSVFLAHDAQTDRHVALKTPLAGQAFNKFRDSAIIAARVNHHNVAKTYDYFEHESQPFLIEEFVNGPNLEEACLPGSFLDPHAGARLFRSLALGLSASHKAGIVHRDLKPSNVIAVGGITLQAVKITDFGIATLTDQVFQDAASSGDLTRSTSGTVRGALPFMSPEMMFRKKGDYPGQPSDVWSIGAMMFRLLTGEYAFGTGFEAAANVKNQDRRPWPNFMTSQITFKDLSIDLQSAVEACLTYNQQDRPTASELVEVCSKLCFADAERQVGQVIEHKGHSNFFIRSRTGEKIYYHRSSAYGQVDPKVDDEVVFSAYPGHPYPRAHPVVII